MSIKDYALELGVSSEVILKKLKELGHKYNNENDYLDDEDIIILDNELGDLSNNNLTEELADKFEMEDRAEEAALAYNIELDNQVKVKEKITLSNGVEIPKLGLGTWFIPDDQAAEAVRQAASIGYRHIDTA